MSIKYWQYTTPGSRRHRSTFPRTVFRPGLPNFRRLDGTCGQQDTGGPVAVRLERRLICYTPANLYSSRHICHSIDHRNLECIMEVMGNHHGCDTAEVKIINGHDQPRNPCHYYPSRPLVYVY